MNDVSKLKKKIKKQLFGGNSAYDIHIQTNKPCKIVTKLNVISSNLISILCCHLRWNICNKDVLNEILISHLKQTTT